MRLLRRAVVAALVLCASAALAQETLVLKDGRRIAVTRLARRDGQVLFETTRGERFSVPEDQVVSPPLESIPLADPPQGQVLELKDGRRIPVARLARRDGQVVFETTRGERFSVPEDQVVSPPLASIPPATPLALGEQVLELKDGRRIPVAQLARRDGQVVFETTKGERFSVTEDQVVSPPLASIAIAPTPGAKPSPAPPQPKAPATTTQQPVPPARPVPPPAPPVPPALPQPGPSGRYPLPDLKPLGAAGGTTVAALDPGDDEFVPMPDRWRLGWPRFDRYRPKQDMPWVEGGLLDPYNQNLMKGDYPIGGNDLFLNLNLQSASNWNPRKVAAGAEQKQLFFNQNFVVGAEIFKGQTVFEPKRWAVRATGVFNLNFLNPESLGFSGLDRGKGKQALEEGFIERRLAVLSPNYDFVSLRAGMQNFTSDFRGYVFSENQLGLRLFGNAGANRLQYNLAWFSMREREEVTQLHGFEGRNQDVLIANLFVQDFLTQGYTALFSVHRNQDDGLAGDPAALRATYLGFHGDGRLGSWNVSHAFYEVLGSDAQNALAGRAVDISARMAALELSRDVDFWRYRASVFYASGDADLRDDTASGFDAISDNPNLAGGAFMFWTQQASKLQGVPGNRPLSDKFSLLPSLRSKFRDRSNFVNPGLLLVNGGIDARVSPKLKLVANASWLRFAKAELLAQLLSRPGLGSTLGLDLGVGLKYRPFLNENLFLVGGLSTLRARGGFAELLRSEASLFSGFLALQMAY